MPWLWRLIGSDCTPQNVQAHMVSDLEEGWNIFGREAEEAVAKLYRVGRCGMLSLGGADNYHFELHHQVEDGEVLRKVAAGGMADHYMLCRWSGPKSIVRLECKQVEGSEYWVSTYKLSGEQIFEKKLDCAEANWFSVAQEVYAHDASIKNLVLVEGSGIVRRCWWPLCLDQQAPSEQGDVRRMWVDFLYSPAYLPCPHLGQECCAVKMQRADPDVAAGQSLTGSAQKKAAAWGSNA